MYAQGIGELLDPTYAPDPNDPNEVRAFQEKQNSMYFVLSKKVRTSTGRRIVQREKHTRNAQVVLYHLINEGTTSTKAVLTGRLLFTKITTARYDPSKPTTAVDFISGFEKDIETYNDQQQDPTCMIGGMMLKNLLQNAFSQVPYLRDVATREKEMAIRGYSMFDYEEYKTLLESASTVYDETKLSRARTSINFVDTHTEPPEDDQDTDEMNPEFSVNVTKGKIPGSSMNKETWNSIEKDDQAIWDQLQDSTKKKILQYACDRAQKKPTTGRINHTSISEDHAEDNTDAEDNQDHHISEEEFTIMKTEIDDVINKARKEAHPADVRRMMGKKKTAQVKFTTILEDDDEETSYEDDELDYLLNQYWDDDEEDFHRGD